MSQQVVNGAQLTCSFGAGPSSLIVLPINRVLVGGQPAATIMDYAPLVNIPMFSMCLTPSNPAVAAATSAALGVLTPVPCVPVTTAPWAPGSPTVEIGDMPALNNTSQCMCMWGGVITISVPGQVQTEVP